MMKRDVFGYLLHKINEVKTDLILPPIEDGSQCISLFYPKKSKKKEPKQKGTKS